MKVQKEIVMMMNSSKCASASFSVIRLNSSIYPNDALKGGATSACIAYNRPHSALDCVYLHCLYTIYTLYIHDIYTVYNRPHCVLICVYALRTHLCICTAQIHSV